MEDKVTEITPEHGGIPFPIIEFTPGQEVYVRCADGRFETGRIAEVRMVAKVQEVDLSYFVLLARTGAKRSQLFHSYRGDELSAGLPFPA